MPVTQKDRKLLWGRSGNRCAICKTELSIKSSVNIIVGEECHIVSKQKNGPRNRIDNNNFYDTYDNLILLCPNHHKEIDKDVKKYTDIYICSLKLQHEKWVIDTLNTGLFFDNSSTDFYELEIIPEIESINHIINILSDTVYSVRCHHVTSSNEKLIYEIFDLVTSCTDIFENLTYSNKHEIATDIYNLLLKLKDKKIKIFLMSKKYLAIQNEKIIDKSWPNLEIFAVDENNTYIKNNEFYCISDKRININ